MLRDDELDLAFLSVTERIESHELGLHQLVSEELVLILPPRHPLSKRRRVRMWELVGEQFISFREGARLRELLATAGHHAGFEPTVKLESNESERIRRLVSRGSQSGVIGHAVLGTWPATGATAARAAPRRRPRPTSRAWP